MADDIAICAYGDQFAWDYVSAAHFVKQYKRRKLHEAGQKIETSTVGHADDNIRNARYETCMKDTHVASPGSIGYTTPASGARSSLYCSDIGKMINAPVLHVSGDYPEDVVRAIEVAFKYRNFFRKDIIIDLIVYRRWCVRSTSSTASTMY